MNRCVDCGGQRNHKARSRCWPCHLHYRRYGPLTDQQEVILDFICRCWIDGWTPTYREISEHVHISLNFCFHQLRGLERREFIQRRPISHRIQLLPKGRERAFQMTYNLSMSRIA